MSICRSSHARVKPAPGEYRRYDRVGRFGDTSYSLEVGEVCMADCHLTRSPCGWHRIKRIE